MPRMPMVVLVVIAGSALAVLSMVAGCAASRSGGVYTPLTESARDTATAQRLTHEAQENMQDDPEKAERLLREALTADLYHGPAHNNLGVLYLGRGELYSAAGEFEWARKLMPGHPNPRLNLALTLEKAGRVDEAIITYKTGLEVYPGHVPTLQALARAQMRHGRADETTAGMLEEIALQGDTRAWREWAHHQRLRLDGSSP